MAKPLRFHAPDRGLTAWLEQHHATAAEVFLVFPSQATGKPAIRYADAVEEALCFDWIDGVKHKLDDERYVHEAKQAGTRQLRAAKAAAAKAAAAKADARKL